MVAHNKRLLVIIFSVATLLSIPFIAMQFTDEVAWTPFDFAVMGILLLGFGLLAEWVLRRVKTKNARIILLAVLILSLLLIWAELAVGIFGTPFAGS